MSHLVLGMPERLARVLLVAVTAAVLAAGTVALVLALAGDDAASPPSRPATTAVQPLWHGGAAVRDLRLDAPTSSLAGTTGP